jgi:preprotein translocase subunit SecG
MVALLWVIYILVCIMLIGIVLLQPGEGGNVASALGASSSQTAFGARGSMSMLQKVTAGLAIAFMVLSIVLSFFMSAKKTSILERHAPAAPVGTPAAPAPAPAPTQPAPNQK